MHHSIAYALFVFAAVAACSVIAGGCSAVGTEHSSAGSPGSPPAPVIPLASQPPARVFVDPPDKGQLALGRVVVRYRTENLRIVPVYGPAALDVSPRVGHLHVTVDDASWHWLDASGDPIVLNGFAPGPHKLLVELADANHKILDSATVRFEIPHVTATEH
ncbi:MAG TPA: DUF6130 family protein [Humisphaera sp.]